MAHHKRRRPKHQRAGCLLCKSHKDERTKNSNGYGGEATRQTKGAALNEQEMIAELGLDQGSLDRACDLAMELIRESGEDPDEVVRKAGETLSYYHDHPSDDFSPGTDEVSDDEE